MTTTAELYDDAIVVRIPPRKDHLIKSVPGARYHVREDDHGAGDHWACQVSWATCVALRGVFGFELQVGHRLAEWAKLERENRIAPAMELRDLLDVPEDQRADGLRGYQESGARFLAVAERAILADEMRLGKTVTAIAAARRLKALPALIVAPNSMKIEWARHVERWWPEAGEPVVLSGGVATRRKQVQQIADGEAQVAIYNWEGLRTMTRLAGYGSVVRVTRGTCCGGNEKETRCEVHDRELNEIAWQLVIADEAHRGAHPRAKQTRALWAVARDAQYRFALTGTPTLDTPEDLWSLGHFIAPEEYPTKTGFVDRYCFTGWNPFGGLEVVGLRDDTRGELYSFLDPRFIRRTRKAVLPELPDKTYARREIEMTPKQRRAYDAMRDEMLAEVDGGVTLVTNALSKILRLRQFACAYAEVTDEGLRLAEPSCTIDALMEVADELAGQPAIVFSESRQLIELAGKRLEKAGIEHGFITGPTPPVERQRTVEKFQRRDLPLLLCTLGAGGEGLTLHAADTVIFMQRSFSRAKNLQAEDRMIGEGVKAEVIDLITADTVMQRVLDVLDEKAELNEEIVRDVETYRRLIG